MLGIFNLLGAGTKFSPLERTDSCEVVSSLEEMLTTHRLLGLELGLSNYPQRFITRYSKNNAQRIQNQESTSTTIVLPYVSGISDAIKQILLSAKVKVYFKPNCTLRQLLVQVKDPTPMMQTSGVVYSIPCRSCSKVYVGQTGRQLQTRINEHKASIKHAKTSESAVAEHVWSS